MGRKKCGMQCWEDLSDGCGCNMTTYAGSVLSSNLKKAFVHDCNGHAMRAAKTLVCKYHLKHGSIFMVGIIFTYQSFC